MVSGLRNIYHSVLSVVVEYVFIAKVIHRKQPDGTMMKQLGNVWIHWCLENEQVISPVVIWFITQSGCGNASLFAVYLLCFYV